MEQAADRGAAIGELVIDGGRLARFRDPHLDALALQQLQRFGAGFQAQQHTAAKHQDANAVIDHANARMIATDRLDRFDGDDVVERWRRLSRG